MASTSLMPCPDCGHAVSRRAVTCPSFCRPLAQAAVREGLFLRTMNHSTKLIFWVIVFLAVVPLVTATLGVLWSRLGR